MAKSRSQKEVAAKGSAPLYRKLVLFSAIREMDLAQVGRQIALDPGCIKDTDFAGNNAMHVCVLGGAAKRAPELMKFLLEETKIDLLHKNHDGLDPLELAISLNDQAACELLEEPSHRQLNERFPLDDEDAQEVGLSDPGPE